MQPRQQSERDAAPDPRARPVRHRREQPQRRPGHQQRSRDLRVDQPRVRHERHGQADRRPCRQPGTRPGDERRQIEHRHASQRAHDRQHDDRAAITADRVRRREQRRQPRRVDRVNHFVQSTLQKVGPQLSGEVLVVVAALVIVFDRDVVVPQQALGDHEIVRLVGARSDRRRRPQPESKIDRQAGREDESPSGQRHPDRARQHRRCGSAERDGQHGPAQRTGEREQRRRAIGQPRQIRNRPEPQQRQRPHGDAAIHACNNNGDRGQRHPELPPRCEQRHAGRPVAAPVDDVD